MVAPGDKEAHIDALVERALRTLLGAHHYRWHFRTGPEHHLDDIRDDLREFGVAYDEWWPELTLTERGAVNKTINRLRDTDYIYEQDGALWFSRPSATRKIGWCSGKNGQITYFASDIAYHLEKVRARLRPGHRCLGALTITAISRESRPRYKRWARIRPPDVLLVQFAIPLPQRRTGADVHPLLASSSPCARCARKSATTPPRFFYVMRKSEQHLDFDLDLAKSQSRTIPYTISSMPMPEFVVS